MSDNEDIEILTGGHIAVSEPDTELADTAGPGDLPDTDLPDTESDAGRAEAEREHRRRSR